MSQSGATSPPRVVLGIHVAVVGSRWTSGAPEGVVVPASFHGADPERNASGRALVVRRERQYPENPAGPSFQTPNQQHANQYQAAQPLQMYVTAREPS